MVRSCQPFVRGELEETLKKLQRELAQRLSSGITQDDKVHSQMSRGIQLSEQRADRYRHHKQLFVHAHACMLSIA